MKSPCATCGQQTEKSSTESPHAALKRPVTLFSHRTEYETGTLQITFAVFAAH